MQDFPKIHHEFNRTMARKSSKNKNKSGELWEDIMESLSKRPFHNMERVEEALIHVGPEKCYLSDELVLALVMQNIMFKPFDIGSKRKSAANAEETLFKGYGWDRESARIVGDLIFSTMDFKMPLEISAFHTKIMNDLRFVRMAFPKSQFNKNNQLLRKEFPTLSDLGFLEAQNIYFRILEEREYIFSLHTIRERFETDAKDNIKMAIISNSVRISTIKQKEKSENLGTLHASEMNNFSAFAEAD